MQCRHNCAELYIYPMEVSMNNTVNRIMICRTDNIGDVVLTLPLAGYLKNNYPNATISFLCRRYAAGVVRNCRFVDRVITLESINDPAEFFAELNLDIIVFAFPSKVLAKAARKAGIGMRIGTSHRLYHWIYCNKLVHFTRVNSTLHEAQLNFMLLRPLGLEQPPTLSDIPAMYGLVAPDNPDIKVLFSPHQFNLILHPKSNGNGREWPIERYAELACLLRSHSDITLWITGSTAEGEWIASHGADLLAMPNVIDVCGRFDLEGLTSFIGSANGLIASGTGPMHLAAALGQRTLGLFPPIKPIHPARWAPLGVRAQTLCRSERCIRCEDINTCSCMLDIAAEEVADIVLGWLEQVKKVLPESKQKKVTAHG